MKVSAPSVARTLLLTAVLLVFIVAPITTQAYVSVKGYYKSNGTYVAPHVRSNPNGLKYDNYGYTPSQGLYNPSYGTRGAAWDTPTYITDPNYYEGKAIYDSLHGSSGGVSVPSTSYTPSNIYQPSAVPANAYASGSSWYCNTGYKTQYDSSYNKIGCLEVVAPLNAYVSGSDWYCKSGYKTIYDSSYNKIGCSQVTAPVNAYVSGSDWYCSSGYKTVYDSSWQKVGCESYTSSNSSAVSSSSYTSSYYTPSTYTQPQQNDKSVGENYYLTKHTCSGLSGDQYSYCITYAYNH